MKKTSLYENHIELSAQMVDFSGWQLPIRYDSIVKEHQAVREGVGIFDVSHMGSFRIWGDEAYDFINHLITNNLNKIKPFEAIYSPILYEDGGMVDDLIVYMVSEKEFFMVVNASNIQKDYDWIVKQISESRKKCEIQDTSEEKSLIAIQGKESEALITQLFSDLPSETFQPYKPFSFYFSKSVKGASTVVASTGYTGEVGVEVLIDNSEAPALFKRAIELGATPCGLGARDSLRLEKGYSLYGHELSAEINPLEASLGWTVSMDKDFIGKSALVKLKEQGLATRLVGLVLEGNRIARENAEVYDVSEKKRIGWVSSGGRSPSLEKNIALAYIERGYKDKAVTIKIRGSFVKATRHSRVFV